MPLHSKKEIAKKTISHMLFYGTRNLFYYWLLTRDIDDPDQAVKFMAVLFATTGSIGFSHWLREITYSADRQIGITQLKQRLPFQRLARSIIISALILQLRVYSYMYASKIDLDAKPMTLDEFYTWVSGAFAMAFAADELPHTIKFIAKKCFGKDLELPTLARLVWETSQFGALAAATLYAYLHPVTADDPLSFAGNPTADSLCIASLTGLICTVVPNLGLELVFRRMTTIRPQDSETISLLHSNKPLDRNATTLTSFPDAEPNRLNWLESLSRKSYKGIFLLAKLIELLPKTVQFLFVSNLAICLGVLYSNIVADQHTDIDAYADYVKSVAAIFGVVLGAWAHQHIYSLVFKQEFSVNPDIETLPNDTVPHSESTDSSENSTPSQQTQQKAVNMAAVMRKLNNAQTNNNKAYNTNTNPTSTPHTKSSSFSEVDLDSQPHSLSASAATSTESSTHATPNLSRTSSVRGQGRDFPFSGNKPQFVRAQFSSRGHRRAMSQNDTSSVNPDQHYPSSNEEENLPTSGYTSSGSASS